ncbi:MAG TPA: hypothetical protein VME43_18210 [Bryobacteraceae bacterium]|nr:hypothetical protein [Bryobacteraceae bacterium]
MSTRIGIPEAPAHELDLLATAEQKPRTAYVVEILWRDVRRSRQGRALKLSAGGWKAADHPELAQGGAALVERSLRPAPVRGDRDENQPDQSGPVSQP